jgi:replicative DNA helicase
MAMDHNDESVRAGERATELPHSHEAECAVLGSLLLDNTVIDRVADVLAGRDFFFPEHRRVFESAQRLLGAGRPADVLTVFEDCGEPMSLLNGMVQSVASAWHAREYAQIVRQRALARQLILVGREIEAAGHRPEGDVPSKIDAAMASLTRLGNGSAAQESVLLDDALVTFIDRLQEEADGNTKVMQTGLVALDRMLAGGLREGELMVIGARPKMGKTALMLALARNMAPRYGVLICSQEMPVHELVARNTAAMGSLNLADLRQAAELSHDGWARVVEAVERMKGMRMVLDEQRALTLADVRRKLMAAKRRQSVDVVVVDFLQLMAGSGENRNRELDEIANGLKAMAGEFKVAVILLSQMSREADKRHGPPVLTDLRDSGAIEAAADVIALLYREFAHPLGRHTDDFRHHAQLELIQRNGAPGTINLRFDGTFQQFSDWDGPAPFKPAQRRGGGE